MATPGRVQQVGPEQQVAFAQPQLPFVPQTGDGFQALMAALAQLGASGKQRRALLDEEAAKGRLMDKEYGLRDKEAKAAQKRGQEDFLFQQEANTDIARKGKALQAAQKAGIVDPSLGFTGGVDALQQWYMERANNANAPAREALYAQRQLQSLTRIAEEYYTTQVRQAGALQDTDIMKRWQADASESMKKAEGFRQLQVAGYTAGAKDGALNIMRLLNEGKGGPPAPAPPESASYIGGAIKSTAKAVGEEAFGIAKDLGSPSDWVGKAATGMFNIPGEEDETLLAQANAANTNTPPSPAPAGVVSSTPRASGTPSWSWKPGDPLPTADLQRMERVVRDGLLTGLDPSYHKMASLAGAYGTSGRTATDLQREWEAEGLSPKVTGDAAALLHSRVLGAMKTISGQMEDNAAIPPNMGQDAGQQAALSQQQAQLNATRMAGLSPDDRLKAMTYLGAIERSLRPVVAYTLDETNTKAWRGQMMEQIIAEGKLAPSDIVDEVARRTLWMESGKIALEAELMGDTKDERYTSFMRNLPPALSEKVQGVAKPLAELYQRNEIAKYAGDEVRRAGGTDEQIKAIQNKIISLNADTATIKQSSEMIRKAGLTPEEILPAWEQVTSEIEGFVDPANPQAGQMQLLLDTMKEVQGVLPTTQKVMEASNTQMQGEYDLVPEITKTSPGGMSYDQLADSLQKMRNDPKALGSEIVRMAENSVGQSPLMGQVNPAFKEEDPMLFTPKIWPQQTYTTHMMDIANKASADLGAMAPRPQTPGQQVGPPAPQQTPPQQAPAGPPAPPGVSRANPQQPGPAPQFAMQQPPQGPQPMQAPAAPQAPGFAGPAMPSPQAANIFG